LDRAVIEERPLRVWIDDRNPIFRLGLSACLEPPRFLVAGESAGFVPAPDLDRTDVLVFELDPGGLTTALRLAQGAEGGTGKGAVRLVAIAPDVDNDLLVEAVEAGVAGALVRAEATPQALLQCLRSVAAGNGSIPTAVLGRLLARPRTGGRPGGAGELTGRELDVLRLLSKGQNTRQIAGDLSYSEKTVKNIVHDVLVRMNCRNRAQAVAMATRRGLI
jgi:DNA-binding NarL/FixJ family response regulator